MRTFTIVCLLLVVSACKKFDGSDINLPHTDKPAWKSVTDTIPDHALLTLRLSLDSTNYDETALIFDHNGRPMFDPNCDASYLTGFGKVSLASISSDGRDMAIYNLPYSQGLSIGLDMHSKKDGVLSLKVNREKNIPADIRILVKDNYARDSLDLRTGSYSFHVTRADTNSFGSKRLRLVLKSGQ